MTSPTEPETAALLATSEPVETDGITRFVSEVTFRWSDEDSPIQVQWRGEGLFCVARQGACWWERQKRWEWESNPSSRTKVFKAGTRYDFDTACRIAQREALVCAEQWAEHVRRWEARVAQREAQR